VGGGARWDFKNKISERFLGFDGVRLCHSQTECSWYDSDVPGNLHFGFVGRAAGFFAFELYIGAGDAQQKGDAPEFGEWWSYFDDPLDTNSIRAGIQLYQQSSLVTINSFRYTIYNARFALRSAQEPVLFEYIAPYLIDPELGPQFPVTFFDGG